MTTPIARARLASIPTGALSLLAPLRGEAGVAVRRDGDRTWITWEAGDERVLGRLLAVPGVVWYVERDGRWHPRDAALPAFDVPPLGDAAVPIARAIGPGPVEPAPVPDPSAELGTIRLRLVRDGRPRPTAGLRCAVADLHRWADAVPSAEIAAVRAARSGDRAALLGAALPSIPGAVRFWGRDVLVPLGFAPAPEWPEPLIRRAAGADAEVDALVWVGDDAVVELIPRDAFAPLTRAGVRLAVAAVAGPDPGGQQP